MLSINFMTMLNKLLLTFSLLFLQTFVWAQATYQITGKVIDAESKEPVPFAQVALYAPGDDKPLEGALTTMEGDFTLKAKKGNYRMAVVYVGYEEKAFDNIQISGATKSLGTISLYPTSTQLEEVVVEAEAVRRPVTTDLEGLNVRPDQTLSNAGGSVLDVLRNTPSISVGSDGSISLRGSGSTNILIDGRNSALAADLEQIPASMVENIKIVNNPNAKYDAQGQGGVINIQLKRAEESGNQAKLGLTTGTRWRTNASLNLSRKTEKYNVYGGYSYRQWPSVGFSSTQRRLFSENELLDQYNDRSRSDQEHTFNYGADFFFGKNKISYEGALNFEDENDEEDNQTSVFNTVTDELKVRYGRFNNETEDNLTLDNAVVYERMFDKKGYEFRALVSHSMRDNNEYQNIDVLRGEQLNEQNGFERSSDEGYRSTSIAQIDYAQPLFDGKLETGYKSTIRNLRSDYLYEIQDMSTGEWVNQTQVSNDFKFQDQVHAAYLIYSQSIGKFDLSAGVRAEQTFVNTELMTTGETNEQQYLNFFPSMQALYKLDDQHSFKFTYSRRIDRPSSRWLNPFPDISDSLNVRIGNPNLQPEFINSFEIGHSATFDKADFTTNFFYRHVNGQVDYIVRVEDGISYRGPDNLNSSMTYGVEFINATQIASWWNINGSFSLFQVQVDGTNLDDGFTNDGISWFAKLTSDFSLPMGVDLQLVGNYTAPEIEAQGRDLARYYLDVNLQRSFMDGKGSVSLSLQDIFDTRTFLGENFGQDFVQEFEYKRESRIFLLSVNYTL